MNWCALCQRWVQVFEYHVHYPVPTAAPNAVALPQPVYYPYPVVWTVYADDPKVSYLENRIMYLERRVQELERKGT